MHEFYQLSQILSQFVIQMQKSLTSVSTPEIKMILQEVHNVAYKSEIQLILQEILDAVSISEIRMTLQEVLDAVSISEIRMTLQEVLDAVSMSDEIRMILQEVLDAVSISEIRMTVQEVVDAVSRSEMRMTLHEFPDTVPTPEIEMDLNYVFDDVSTLEIQMISQEIVDAYSTPQQRAQVGAVVPHVASPLSANVITVIRKGREYRRDANTGRFVSKSIRYVRTTNRQYPNEHELDRISCSLRTHRLIEDIYPALKNKDIPLRTRARCKRIIENSLKQEDIKQDA